MKVTLKMPAPTGVAASSTAICPLPIGFSYETLYLVMGGTSFSASFITGIRLIANGQIIMQFSSGSDLDSINQFNGRAASATKSILMLDMVRYNLKTREAIEITKLGTGKAPDVNQFTVVNGQQVRNPNYNPYPVQTLNLEVDINANVSANLTLSLYAKQSAAAITGLIQKMRQSSYPVPSTALEIADLPKGDLLDAVFFKTSGKLPKITNVILLKDQVKQFDRTNTLNDAIQTDGKYKTSQSGWFVHDTTEEGFGTESIQTAGVNDFRYQLTFSGAPAGTSMPTYVRYLGHLTR